MRNEMQKKYKFGDFTKSLLRKSEKKKTVLKLQTNTKRVLTKEEENRINESLTVPAINLACGHLLCSSCCNRISSRIKISATVCIDCLKNFSLCCGVCDVFQIGCGECEIMNLAHFKNDLACPSRCTLCKPMVGSDKKSSEDEPSSNHLVTISPFERPNGLMAEQLQDPSPTRTPTAANVGSDDISPPDSREVEPPSNRLVTVSPFEENDGLVEGPLQKPCPTTISAPTTTSIVDAVCEGKPHRTLLSPPILPVESRATRSFSVASQSLNAGGHYSFFHVCSAFLAGLFVSFILSQFDLIKTAH